MARIINRVGLVVMNRIQEELGGGPSVLGRPGETVSALVNLIVNAIDATVSRSRPDGTAMLRGERPGSPSFLGHVSKTGRDATPASAMHRVQQRWLEHRW